MIFSTNIDKLSKCGFLSKKLPMNGTVIEVYLYSITVPYVTSSPEICVYFILLCLEKIFFGLLRCDINQDRHISYSKNTIFEIAFFLLLFV